MVVFHSCVDKTMRDCSPCIGQVEPGNSWVPLDLLGLSWLRTVCYKYLEKPGYWFLNWCVDILVLHRESGQPSFQDREKVLAFHSQERNCLEWADYPWVHFLGYKAPLCPLPGWWNFTHNLRNSFHNLWRSIRHILYTMNGIEFGPGADDDRAFCTVSSTSLHVGSSSVCVCVTLPLVLWCTTKDWPLSMSLSCGLY